MQLLFFHDQKYIVLMHPSMVQECELCHSVSSSFAIVCPGNEIPNWFDYEKDGSSVNMKLPANWFLKGFLGFALSLVVAFDNYNVKRSLRFECKSNFKTINIGEESGGLNCTGQSCGRYLNSDHLFVWYDINALKVEWKADNEGTQACFEFYQLGNGSKVKVKRCGISLFDADKFHVMSEEPQVEEDVEDRLTTWMEKWRRSSSKTKAAHYGRPVDYFLGGRTSRGREATRQTYPTDWSDFSRGLSLLGNRLPTPWRPVSFRSTTAPSSPFLAYFIGFCFLLRVAM